MGRLRKEELQQKIELFADAMVNKTHGVKSASYRIACLGIGYKEEELPNCVCEGYRFYEKYKDKIDPIIEKLKEENRKREPDIRDQNISILQDIIANDKSAKNRMQAMKMLNDMLGLETKNLNIKTDDTIKVELTE